MRTRTFFAAALATTASTVKLPIGEVIDDEYSYIDDIFGSFNIYPNTPEVSESY